MNQTQRRTNLKQVKAEFSPETRFELKPKAGESRAEVEARFNQLKQDLLARELWEASGAHAVSQLRHAAREASALAWVTPYPLLVFPGLFEEKAQVVRFQAERQEEILERSRELIGV